ncbi:LysR family transcriptional regulator [Bosea sp. 2KB_26]|uniref:LysR family transcriptional regulator n=1 Tax=Bosea sp. 2KB_26 TaxID=3237475 RepID=UPI000DE34BCE
MKREDLADLSAFMAVAEAGSFTLAAAKLGMSQSALSQIVRRLEGRLGLSLLRRTTRSVSPTDAGERLLQTLVPALSGLDESLAALSEMREKPAGTIRITSVEHATDTIIYPVLKTFLPRYPDVSVEIVSDYGLVDIVAERFDAGIRLGEHVDKDMIAVRIAPDLEMTMVGSPAYFTELPAPTIPQDLVRHRCINLRLSASRGHFVWDFRKDGRELKVRADGPLAFNTIELIEKAALDGFGLGFLPRDKVRHHLEAGSLISVLEDWCPSYPGYHLYYPSRRQPTPAFALLVDALRLKR